MKQHSENGQLPIILGAVGLVAIDFATKVASWENCQAADGWEWGRNPHQSTSACLSQPYSGQILAPLILFSERDG